METSTTAAFEQRQKEEEAREARRREKAAAAEPEAEPPPEHVHGPECEHAPQPYRRETPKLGRNDPCHCGSGKKLKKCHGA